MVIAIISQMLHIIQNKHDFLKKAGKKRTMVMSQHWLWFQLIIQYLLGKRNETIIVVEMAEQ